MMSVTDYGGVQFLDRISVWRSLSSRVRFASQLQIWTKSAHSNNLKDDQICNSEHNLGSRFWTKFRHVSKHSYGPLSSRSNVHFWSRLEVRLWIQSNTWYWTPSTTFLDQKMDPLVVTSLTVAPSKLPIDDATPLLKPPLRLIYVYPYSYPMMIFSSLLVFAELKSLGLGPHQIHYRFLPHVSEVYFYKK